MRMTNQLLGLGALSALLWSSAAAAAEPSDTLEAPVVVADELDDILGEPNPGSSESETQQLKDGELGDSVGARKEIVLEEDDKKKKTVIKTLARKNFLKLGRFEASPHIAFVANDPFLNRYVETSLDFAPDLGEGDWKPLTTQLVTENSVSPDISKLTLFGAATFQYSPIYGKLAVVGRNIVNFDVYGAFGMGFTRTTDDLTALGAEDDELAKATQFQTHPTTNFGGGVRIIFGESIAARVEARSLVYIETVKSTNLEMKNNLLVQGAVSFFFPNMK